MGFLLQENGDFLLQENGDKILLEGDVYVTTSVYRRPQIEIIRGEIPGIDFGK